MTGTSAVVTAAWLAGSVDDPHIKPVDATWFLPPTDRDARAEYQAAHIPGAVYFDIDEIADRTSGLPHTLPSADQFATAVGALGIGNGDHVVVYDAQGIYSSPRVWWMFRVFGHERVSVLDGGLAAWHRASHPTTAERTAAAASEFSAKLQAPLLTGIDAVRGAVDGGGPRIVDVRPPARFAGSQPEPRPGVRGGHMPGAINLPFGQLLTVEGDSFLPRDELVEHFRAAGIGDETDVITTCGSGVTACILSLGLHLTGHQRWSVYDGSWTEWGSREDTQVEKSTA